MTRALALLVAFTLAAAPVARAQETGATPAPAPSPAPTRAPEPGKEVRALDAAWRSTLIPGWGQRYKGEKVKGWLFTGIAAGLVVGTIATMRTAGEAAGKLQDQTRLDEESRNAARASITFYTVAGLTTAFWAYAVSESAFLPAHTIRIHDARIENVFPSIRLHYLSNPIASVTIQNQGREPLERVTVRFEAKDLQDAPAEAKLSGSIAPGMQRAIPLAIAFNEKLLDVGQSEPRKVQARIVVDYDDPRGRRRTLTRTATFTVYNRNAIVWDDARKMAAFVTPRDESVRAHASAIARLDSRASAVHAISVAAALFDGLGAWNVVYISDPLAPFSAFDGNAAAVDYLAYPSETLDRRAGDCDDLVALYASLLEGSGIRTAIVDVPGHVFLAFDTGLTGEEMRRYLGGGEGSFVVRDGSAWIPVEVTAVGKPFTDAWTLAAAETAKWSGVGQLAYVDVARAQEEFPPAPPGTGGPRLDPVESMDRSAYLELSAKDAARLRGLEAGTRSAAIAEVRARKLAPAVEQNEIGIVHARDGRLPEAMSCFREAIRFDPRFAKAHNNLGNIAFLEGRPDEALRHYRDAAAAGMESAALEVNLANLYLEQGDTAAAGEHFRKAVRLEPAYERDFPELAPLLSNAADLAATPVMVTPDKAAPILDTPQRVRWVP